MDSVYTDWNKYLRAHTHGRARAERYKKNICLEVHFVNTYLAAYKTAYIFYSFKNRMFYKGIFKLYISALKEFPV